MFLFSTNSWPRQKTPTTASHTKNNTEDANANAHGSDAALCQIILTTCYYCNRVFVYIRWSDVTV